MFAVTYLGHQGWLVAGRLARLLIDPLLTDEYSPGFRAVIHPPRTIDLERFPPIDAVVLSHEHSDHWNVPSLARLDRRIPVVLPARSARAVRDAIARMGFRVLDARPGDRFAIGDLELRCFSGERGDDELEGEWANLLLLVSDRDGDGSLFTYVDGWPSQATLDAIGRVGLFCHANNVMDWSCLEGGRVPEAARPTTQGFAGELLRIEAGWWRDGAAPSLTTVCGPGLAFVGADAWLNQILTVDSERVCAALAAAWPERAFRAPLPGETFHFRRGELARTEARAPFMVALERRRWPRLARLPPRALIRDVSPASDGTLDDDRWATLVRDLDALASFLYGRSLFRALHALDDQDLEGRRAAFALVLRTGRDAAYVCEYIPEASRFAVVDCARPIATYVAGLECWAHDLVAVLRGEILPQRLLGHLRTWSFAPSPLSPLSSVWRFFDLVHRPEAGRAFYDAQIASLGDTAPAIEAGASAARIRRGRRR